MRIVVTGAKGQLGGELCRQLGTDAYPLDIDELDLTQAEAVRKRMLDLRPTAIINCAAYTQVDKAESDAESCRAINTTAVEHLAAVCNQWDCLLVQISTDYVFGRMPQPYRPWREDDPPHPQGVYAGTKLAGEQAARRAGKHLIIRTCGLYARPSARQAANFLRTILRLSETQADLQVVDDQHCTPTYVPHLSRAILFLIGYKGRPAPSGIYHVTNQGETTWYHFAVEILRLAGRQTAVRPITSEEFGAAAPRPAYSVLDTSAYHRLGGPVMPHWKAALAEYFTELKLLQTEKLSCLNPKSP